MSQKAKSKIRKVGEELGFTQAKLLSEGDAEHGRLKNPEKIASICGDQVTFAATERGSIHTFRVVDQ